MSVYSFGFSAVRFIGQILPALRLYEAQPSLPTGPRHKPEELWRTVPSKVLFLDFDGVLHRKMTGTFEHLPAFEHWLRSTTDLGVVISSSWRNAARGELERIFSKDLRHLIVGRTVSEGCCHTRQLEVLKFVAENDVADFMVLDDDDDEFEPSWAHRIRTEYSTGLTHVEIDLLSKWSSDLVGQRLAVDHVAIGGDPDV